MFNFTGAFDVFGSNKEWKDEKRNLLAFGEKLRSLGEPQSSKDIFEYLVDFLQICSDFQDKVGDLHHCPDYETMCDFNYALKRSGRNKYGWNRTQKGERVTMDNVYLGDIFGLFTHTARTWATSDSIYDGFYHQWTRYKGNMPDPSMREVIGQYQVLPFVVKNRQALLDNITKMAA
ncbi:MAG: hypothetical protein IJ223_05025 [Clostridia bacterium]|nr:hypothetical protein [Clostridia bacterium]